MTWAISSRLWVGPCTVGTRTPSTRLNSVWIARLSPSQATVIRESITAWAFVLFPSLSRVARAALRRDVRQSSVLGRPVGLPLWPLANRPPAPRFFAMHAHVMEKTSAFTELTGVTATPPAGAGWSRVTVNGVLLTCIVPPVGPFSVASTGAGVAGLAVNVRCALTAAAGGTALNWIGPPGPANADRAVTEMVRSPASEGTK